MQTRVLILAGILAAAQGGAATFTVINTNDSGAGSLRQAILDANATMGLDTIAFDIPGTGVHTISPASNLPSVTSPVIIDGYTQPGSSPNTLTVGDDAVLQIEIDGTSTIGTGIRINAPGGSTVRGLVINRCTASAVRLDQSNDNVIEGNFIGVDSTGLTLSGASAWLTFLAGSSNNRVGGTTPAARNVIAGNVGAGGSTLLIELSDDNLVQGNYIGVNAAGVAALPTTTDITLKLSSSSGNVIGGTAPGAGNVIFGQGAAVYLNNVSTIVPSTNNTIQGNFFGTDATGTVGQGGNGIIVQTSIAGSSNTIGGSAPGAGNLISGMGVGIQITGTGNWIIQGNRIGTDASGTGPVPNNLGIQVANPAATGQIGGIDPGEGNTIAFNGGSGIEVKPGNLNWPIRGNSMFSNGSLGIDLENLAGPSPNDPGDADDGGNHLQNFPIIQSVEHTANAQGAASTRVLGKLNTTPSTTFDLDFYADPPCSSFPREFLQGRTWLGTAQVTTDGSGFAATDVTLPVATDAGARITATATDPAGNTSEFSQRIIFSIAPASGDSAGGAAIAVSGTDFADPTTITVGGVGVPVTFQDDHTLSFTSPALGPGTVHDIVAMTPDGTTGTLLKGWVSDFLDVPGGHLFYSFVTTLVSNAITAGVGGGFYGVDQPTKRQQMAVFLLKAEHGLCYTPPPCSGVFTDVPCSLSFAPWIEALAAEGITTGCGNGIFCPDNPVTRRQMAIFLLKTKYGASYLPPDCAGIFGDVACPGLPANFIEELYNENITGGCSAMPLLYCPDNSSTRGQMAVFITKTFGLQ